jgi:hypothetical protein
MRQGKKKGRKEKESEQVVDAKKKVTNQETGVWAIAVFGWFQQ